MNEKKSKAIEKLINRGSATGVEKLQLSLKKLWPSKIVRVKNGKDRQKRMKESIKFQKNLILSKILVARNLSS